MPVVVFTHVMYARVDYCKLLLAGCNKAVTDKLPVQRVMKAAARVVGDTSKYDRGLRPLRHVKLDVADWVTFKLLLLFLLIIIVPARHLARFFFIFIIALRIGAETITTVWVTFGSYVLPSGCVRPTLRFTELSELAFILTRSAG